MNCPFKSNAMHTQQTQLIKFPANQTPQIRICDFEGSKLIKFTSKPVSNTEHIDEYISEHEAETVEVKDISNLVGASAGCRAPEFSLWGKGALIFPADDIFSIGVVLYDVNHDLVKGKRSNSQQALLGDFLDVFYHVMK